MKLQKGFAAISGGVGWYVWRAKNSTDNSYNNLTKANSTLPKYSSVKNFEDCQKAPNSKTQETSPEVCVTKDGKRFTDNL